MKNIERLFNQFLGLSKYWQTIYSRLSFTLPLWSGTWNTDDGTFRLQLLAILEKHSKRLNLNILTATDKLEGTTQNSQTMPDLLFQQARKRKQDRLRKKPGKCKVDCSDRLLKMMITPKSRSQSAFRNIPMKLRLHWTPGSREMAWSRWSRTRPGILQLLRWWKALLIPSITVLQT